MKVSIIGGAGRVGSNAAFALQMGAKVREIVLVDMAADVAEGEALDLRHGTAFTGAQTIVAGGYDAVNGSDCVVITAGLRRKPDESRLELINRNVTLFREILGNVRQCKLADGATILVVSNPVDILTMLAVKESGLPANRVFGLGTTLDTCRFRSLIAAQFGVAAPDVDALILGEHGDSMVPMWSSATVNGISIKTLPGWSDQVAQDLFEFTKKSGAEVIRLKGGAGWAVGVSIARVVEAMALDTRQMLPVSVLQEGALGIRDICLSLPTIVGKGGVHKVLEPVCTEEEANLLRKSEAALKEVWAQIS